MIFPSLGEYSLESNFIRVLLPLPLSPTIPTNWPLSISKVTLSKTLDLLLSKEKVTSSKPTFPLTGGIEIFCLSNSFDSCGVSITSPNLSKLTLNS